MKYWKKSIKYWPSSEQSYFSLRREKETRKQRERQAGRKREEGRQRGKPVIYAIQSNTPKYLKTNIFWEVGNTWTDLSNKKYNCQKCTKHWERMPSSKLQLWTVNSIMDFRLQILLGRSLHRHYLSGHEISRKWNLTVHSLSKFQKLQHLWTSGDMSHLLQKDIQKIWNICSEDIYMSYWAGHSPRPSWKNTFAIRNYHHTKETHPVPLECDFSFF